MKTVRIGIMSQKQIRERTLAIARGEYTPRSDEPKVWFTSIHSLATGDEVELTADSSCFVMTKLL